MQSTEPVGQGEQNSATGSQGSAQPRHDSWGKTLAPYARARVDRAALDIATSIVPYFALSVLMYLALDVSYLLTLAIAIPAAGFLLRTFIVFHDCGHGSFLPSKRANTWLGVVSGLVVYQAFHSWRHAHAVHHATAGDLDRRGTGDVLTWTVAEYQAASWPKRFAYRMFRNPLVMVGLGPIWSLVIQPRLILSSMRPRIKRTVIATNVTLALLVAAVCWLIGWKEFLLVQAPTAWLAGAAGVWLFYVQHQFEDAYWESNSSWSYADAALQGSSYLKLPKVLQFFTGNIGLHHVHHLSASIPNYNLQRAHDENAVFHSVPVLSIREGMRSMRLKLIDEGSGQLVTFGQARQMGSAAPAPAAS